MDGPRREKAWKNKGADQHAFPRIPISAFVFDSGKNNDLRATCKRSAFKRSTVAHQVGLSLIW